MTYPSQKLSFSVLSFGLGISDHIGNINLHVFVTSGHFGRRFGHKSMQLISIGLSFDSNKVF